MASPDPPEVLELFETIASLLPTAKVFQGALLRSVGTRYANEVDFLSGWGASQHGGRWNRRGIRALYGSLDVLTATHEAYQTFAEFGFTSPNIRPRVMAGIQAKLQFVFDLTAQSTRRRIGFTLQELLKEDWPELQRQGEESWTQAIGRGCRNAGFEALQVPSARNKGGVNLVVFPDCLRSRSQLDLLAPEDLPPHPKDWLT